MSAIQYTNNIGQLRYQSNLNCDGGKSSSSNQQPVPVLPADRVSLSKEALAQNGGQAAAGGLFPDNRDLSAEERQAVNDLRSRDTEVKAHEAAHMAAGGGIVQGGASYQYQSGPDGKMYAVGGEVQIDVSPENTPEATIRKMQQIRQAALAPSQPSGTDRAVAAQASQIEAQARVEKLEKAAENQEDQARDVLPADPTRAHRPQDASPAKGSRIDFMV